jgi:hypothetical protein
MGFLLVLTRLPQRVEEVLAPQAEATVDPALEPMKATQLEPELLVRVLMALIKVLDILAAEGVEAVAHKMVL